MAQGSSVWRNSNRTPFSGQRISSSDILRVASAVDVDFRIHLIEYCRDSCCSDHKLSLYSF